jgi:hypothetical protein
MSKARKSKATEPSLRDRLGASFMAALEADFQKHGVAALEKMREASPERYCELATKAIASAEPLGIVFAEAKSMQDIGRGLLAQVGLHDPTDQQIELAIAANDRLVAELEMIMAMDVGLQVAEEYETRELRS